MDFIKIILSDTHIFFWPERRKELEPEIIEAIIEEAHKHGKPVACHVDNLDQANIAFECGTDEIHHMVNAGSPRYELTEYGKLFVKMCERHVWLVPTFAAPRVSEGARIDKKCFDGGIDYNINALRMAYEYGVPFGLGCDSGCPGVPWGKCVWEETAEYVYNLGMTPLEAIKCVTVNNARMLGLENKIGAVRAGAFADLLALDKNPADDIGNLGSVYMVLRDGAIVTDNR
jgi:imidazolonepropionase-like amidohydrolase